MSTRLLGFAILAVASSGVATGSAADPAYGDVISMILMDEIDTAIALDGSA